MVHVQFLPHDAFSVTMQMINIVCASVCLFVMLRYYGLSSLDSQYWQCSPGEGVSKILHVRRVGI